MNDLVKKSSNFKFLSYKKNRLKITKRQTFCLVLKLTSWSLFQPQIFVVFDAETSKFSSLAVAAYDSWICVVHAFIFGDIHFIRFFISKETEARDGLSHAGRT